MSNRIRRIMKQLNNTYHSGMAGYLMDFGFGGFIGYGKGVSGRRMMSDGCEDARGTGQWHQHQLKLRV